MLGSGRSKKKMLWFVPGLLLWEVLDYFVLVVHSLIVLYPSLIFVVLKNVLY